MTRRTGIGAGCLLLACLIGSMLPQLAWLDESVLRQVQGWRTCTVADSAGWIDVAVRLVLLGLAAGLGSRKTTGWQTLAGLALVVLCGAVVGEILKTVFERTRPNEPPGDFSGNSFPSGHVMNTTLAAAALVDLARRTGFGASGTAAVAAMGMSLVLAQATYRIVNGSHWLTDATASTLLGIGWVLLAGELTRERTDRKVFVGGAMAAVVAYAVFYSFPQIRLTLPSVLDRSSPPLGRLELGTPQTGLGGRWSHGWREPVGGVSWILSRRSVIRLPLPERGGADRLRLTMRPPGPHEGAEGCVRVRVTIDGAVEEVALLEGWREYLFAVSEPDEVLVVGIEVLDDLRRPRGRAPGRLAVHDVRLD